MEVIYVFGMGLQTDSFVSDCFLYNRNVVFTVMFEPEGACSIPGQFL